MEPQNKIQKELLEELGLSDLPRDKKEQLVIKMTEVILKRIFLETMEKLDERGREEYERMVEDGASSAEMDKFLTEKIKNYESLVQEVVEKFREEMKKE